jgi:hypothetical protein
MQLLAVCTTAEQHSGRYSAGYAGLFILAWCDSSRKRTCGTIMLLHTLAAAVEEAASLYSTGWRQQQRQRCWQQ